MEKNLFELMEKYALTLRRLPTKTYTSYKYDENRTRTDGIIIECPLIEMSESEFLKCQKQGRYATCRWQNGFVIERYYRVMEKRDGGWLVKISGGYGSVQHWDMKKNDFYGVTPKDAIMKAVKHIERTKKETNEKRKKAGLSEI